MNQGVNTPFFICYTLSNQLNPIIMTEDEFFAQHPELQGTSYEWQQQCYQDYLEELEQAMHSMEDWLETRDLSNPKDYYAVTTREWWMDSDPFNLNTLIIN